MLPHPPGAERTPGLHLPRQLAPGLAACPMHKAVRHSEPHAYGSRCCKQSSRRKRPCRQMSMWLLILIVVLAKHSGSAV